MQTVLVIDDSVDSQDLVEFLLQNSGIALQHAMSGAEGLSAAIRQPPDLILLDVEMPELNGFDVCRALKEHPATMNVPIVFLTGASKTDEKTKGLDLGAIDYITKPFDPAELRARVAAGLRTKYLMDLLTKRAMIDALTGLWNRGYFDQRLRNESMAAERSGAPLACIALDVDHFKAINDRHGHAGGDHVLQQVAATIRETAREADVVARVGGEEFAILVPRMSRTGASMLAERVRGAIERLNLTWRDQRVPVTCSFGVADNSSPITTGDGGGGGGGGGGGASRFIVERADAALYVAKDAGRNRVAVDQGDSDAATASAVGTGRIVVTSGPGGPDVRAA